MAIDTLGLQVSAGYRIIMDGISGTNYMTYDSNTQYVRFYLNGALRMEL